MHLPLPPDCCHILRIRCHNFLDSRRASGRAFRVCHRSRLYTVLAPSATQLATSAFVPATGPLKLPWIPRSSGSGMGSRGGRRNQGGGPCESTPAQNAVPPLGLETVLRVVQRREIRWFYTGECVLRCRFVCIDSRTLRLPDIR